MASRYSSGTKSYTLLILNQNLKGTMFDGEGMFKSELCQHLHVFHSQPCSKCKRTVSRRNLKSDTRQHTHKQHTQPSRGSEEWHRKSWKWMQRGGNDVNIELKNEILSIIKILNNKSKLTTEKPVRHHLRWVNPTNITFTWTKQLLFSWDIALMTYYFVVLLLKVYIINLSI